MSESDPARDLRYWWLSRPPEVTCPACGDRLGWQSGDPAMSVAHLLAAIRSHPCWAQAASGKCSYCGEPVRRTEPGDHIDPAEYEWVHEDGNPICPITAVAAP